jgi:Secretion system C-terminal sorting domain
MISGNGDISFSLSYTNLVIQDTADVLDLDPWMLPRKVLTARAEPRHAQQAIQLQAFTNPCTDVLQVQVQLQQAQSVTIWLEDMMGKTVQTLMQAQQNASGTCHLQSGIADLAPGMYHCVVTAGGATTRRLICKQ